MLSSLLIRKISPRAGFTNIQISPGSGPEAGTFVEKDNLSAEAGKDNQSQPGPAGVPYFIELNSIPGMSRGSIVPKQAREMGMSLGKLYDIIIADTCRK